MWDLNCTTSVIKAPSTGVFRPKFYKNEKVWRHEKQILLVLRLFKVLRMSSDKRYFHMSQTCKNDPRPPSRSKGCRLVIFWYFDKRNLPLHIYVCRKLSQRLKIFCPTSLLGPPPDSTSSFLAFPHYAKNDEMLRTKNDEVWRNLLMKWHNLAECQRNLTKYGDAPAESGRIWRKIAKFWRNLAEKSEIWRNLAKFSEIF